MPVALFLDAAVALFKRYRWLIAVVPLAFALAWQSWQAHRWHKAADKARAAIVALQAASDANKAAAIAQVEAQRRYAMRQAAKPVEAAEWWEGYDAYLGSDDWQRRRAAVMARDGSRCQAALPGCTKTATEVHHLSYTLHKAVGAAPLWDLVAICHACHAAVTEAERAARKKS